MGLFDDMFGKGEKPDWMKQDYEICARCSCTRMYHNVACNQCHECNSFIASGEIADNP